MGLDVYVGSLTRYYTREWETVVEKYSRENNLKFKFVGLTGAPPVAKQPREEVFPIIEEWREGLRVGLAENLKTPLDWSEAEDTPYFTDKPAWDCYGALLILAAHQEHPQFPLPPKAEFDFHDNPSYKASTASDFRSTYSNLLLPELWLPYETRLTFKAELGNQDIWVGSTHCLLEELWKLNNATYKATRDQFQEWVFAGTEKDAQFEIASRFAMGIMLKLAEEAVRHKLPMKLDY